MKQTITKTLANILKKKEQDIENMLEIPPNLNMGDYAYPCYSLAKEKKQNPLIIAEELTQKIRKKLPKNITNIEQKGAYINFYLDRIQLTKETLKETNKKSWGTTNLGKGKSIGIEFSQPNTHKAFHVGHIRGTSIGESLARIMESQGKKVVRMNYSGDTGMHIAKWIWGYKKFHEKEKLQDNESWIAHIYVEAVSKLAEDEEGKKGYQKEVEEINRKIETKEDKEINDLWKKTRALSIKSWNTIYQQLNTHFDKHYFESEIEIPAKKIAEELYKKKIAKKDDAIFMDLKKDNLGVWVLLRKDGTVLYSAKDLALAKQKIKDYNLDDYLVTVADEQKMHFEQLCKTLEKMSFKKAKHYNFLTFGLVRFPEGKMSSRTGNNTLYSDFYKKVFNTAYKNIDERVIKVNKKEIKRRAQIMTIAAIKYGMLKQDHNKTIIFDPQQAVSFEGDTGPYLLYSYARANTLIKKVKSNKKTIIKDLKKQEIQLIKKIAKFTETIKKAYKEKSPNLIANYSFELCQLFNEFYHECPVLGSKEEGLRLKIVNAFRKTLKKSLKLLGIETLEEM